MRDQRSNGRVPPSCQHNKNHIQKTLGLQVSDLFYPWFLSNNVESSSLCTSVSKKKRKKEEKKITMTIIMPFNLDNLYETNSLTDTNFSKLTQEEIVLYLLRKLNSLSERDSLKNSINHLRKKWHQSHINSSKIQRKGNTSQLTL